MPGLRAACFALPLLVACGTSTTAPPGSDGGGDDQSASQGDMSMSTPPDMTMAGDMATTPKDMTVVPDLTAPTTLDVIWVLATADIQGGNNNGFTQDCQVGDGSEACGTTGVWCGVNKAGTSNPWCVPPITSVNFYMQNVGGGPITTTTVTCPAADHGATASVKLPDPTGPYNIWANVGAPNSSVASSTWVKPFGPDQSGNILVTVYACECSYPQSGSDPACASPGQ